MVRVAWAVAQGATPTTVQTVLLDPAKRPITILRFTITISKGTFVGIANHGCNFYHNHEYRASNTLHKASSIWCAVH